MRMLYKIEEVSEKCRVPAAQVHRFIAYAWISPADPDQEFFDDEDVARIQLILSLEQEFGVNEEAIPIVLQLVDQLNFLHRKLRH